MHDAARPLARSLTHSLHLFGGATHESLRMCAWGTTLSPSPRPRHDRNDSLRSGRRGIVVFVVLLSLGSSFQFQSNNSLAAHARLPAALPDESKPVLNANRNS